MKLPFWKMHGAGNDFILFDSRQVSVPTQNTVWLQTIGSRKTGIGCDGIILIQPSENNDFQMRFFNPDGTEVEMCGNGARCVARLAYDLGVAGSEMAFDTVAGVIAARIEDDLVRLQMTPPSDWRLDRSLQVNGMSLSYCFVNSGVPHVVVEVDDLSRTDVAGLGAGIRCHADFAPAGTNVNFIQVTGPGSLKLRTYERGVEGETLACGTGMVASALIAARNRRVSPPVALTCASRDELAVDFELTSQGAASVSLLGPAVHVFQGEVDAPCDARDEAVGSG